MPLIVLDKGDPTPEQRATYDRDEIIERFRFWQHALNLDHWTITLSIIPNYSLEGHTQRWLGNTEAWIKIREDQCIGAADETLCHELLHLITAPWKDAYYEALGGYDDKTAKLLRNMVKDPEEQVIECLAKLFVSVSGGDYWAKGDDVTTKSSTSAV